MATTQSSSLVNIVKVNLAGQDQAVMELSPLRHVFSYSHMVHAVAGAVGSAFSMTVFYPLDTARTRLQVDDQRKAKHSPVIIAEIVREEGVTPKIVCKDTKPYGADPLSRHTSLYRGLFSVVSSLCVSNFVYFYTYNCLKAVCLGDLGKPDPLKDLTLAFIAGVVNVLVTTPLWVVNTRLRIQGAKFRTDQYRDTKKTHYKGIFDAFCKIIKFEGVSALWNGTKPSLILASNPSVQFMVYETIKRYFQRSLHTVELSGFLYFIIGAIAKTVATVVTYPLQVLQSRLRAGYSKEHKMASMYEAFVHIVRTRGVHSLYKGMEAKLLQTVLTAALMFMVYEKLTATIFRLMGHEYVKVTR